MKFVSSSNTMPTSFQSLVTFFIVIPTLSQTALTLGRATPSNVLSAVEGVNVTQSPPEFDHSGTISENVNSAFKESIPDEFIYVYDIGAEYNEDLKSSGIRWWSEQYEPEYILHEMFAVQNISRTFDPETASLFYVPFLSARFTLLNFVDDHDGRVMKEAVRKTSEVWKKIMTDIRKKYPYFSRSNGKNHFSVLTMDHGRCTALTFCDPSVYGDMFFFQASLISAVFLSHKFCCQFPTICFVPV